MREFILYINSKITSDFELNNLPGSGRIDIISRCVSSALWLSYSIRKDSVIRIFLSKNKKLITFFGRKIKKISPDERNIASWIKKVMKGYSNPGISYEMIDFQNLLD